MEQLKLTAKEYKPFKEAYERLSGQTYRGRKVKVNFTEKVWLHDTNWSGGTRNWYYFFNMENSKGKTLVVPAPWLNGIEGEAVDLPAEIIVIERSHFCGKDLGLTIHAHPSRRPAFLEAQNA